MRDLDQGQRAFPYAEPPEISHPEFRGDIMHIPACGDHPGAFL